MTYRRFIRQVLLVLIGVVVVAAYPAYAYASVRLAVSVGLAALVCLLNVLVGCYSAVWAFDRSEAAFYKALFGGMLGRMAGIGIVFFVLVKFTDVHVSGLTLSLFFFYVMFLILELRFLLHYLAARKGLKEA